MAVAVLLSAVSARALTSRGSGTAGFAVASGVAVFAVLTDVSGDLVLRRLGLDGGIFWEDHWGRGQAETPVDAAIAQGGGVSVVGEDASGCFVAQWNAHGGRLWATNLQYGSECRARATVVDSSGATYALGTTMDRGVPAPTLWKVDRLGSILWYYRPSDAASRYAFALTLDADGAGVTVTAAASGPAGWVYKEFNIDSLGRPRAAPRSYY